MKTILELIFHGIAALAALTVAVIALWGAFFTDIPEALIRQLSVDISEAREDVVDLKQERRRLQEQVAKLDSEVNNAQVAADAAEKKRAEAELRLHNTQTNLATEKQNLIAIQKEKGNYLNQLIHIVVIDIISKIKKDISELSGKANQARQLPEFRAWVARKKMHEDLVSKARAEGDFQKIYALIEQRRARLPEAWEMANPLFGFSNQDTPEGWLKDYEKQLTQQSRTPPVTGEVIIDGILEQAKLDLLLAKDRKQLVNRCQRFIADNRAVLSRPTDFGFLKNLTDDDVVRRATQVLQNLEAIRAILPDLQTRLLLNTDTGSSSQK